MVWDTPLSSSSRNHFVICDRFVFEAAIQEAAALNYTIQLGDMTNEVTGMQTWLEDLEVHLFSTRKG